MTLFDLIVIAVLLVSSVFALLRGLTREVLSILSWIVGALVALWLFPYVTPILLDVISPPWLASVAAAIGLFLIAYAICAAVTTRWSGGLLNLHERAELLDRTLGLIFGVVRGLFIVAIAYLFFLFLAPNPDRHPDWIRTAKTLPTVENVAALLMSFAPKSDETREQPTRAREPEPRRTPPARQEMPRYTPPATPAPAPAETRQTPAQPAPSRSDNSDADTGKPTGYNPSERRGLDRLFENSAGD